MGAPRASERDLSGETIDRFLLVRRLGVGGMGAVYEAEHTFLHRRVALKVLRDRLADDETSRKRFLREAKAVSSIEHPNVVDIIDYGETAGGIAYFAMQLLRGEDLGDLLRRESRLPWDRAQDILTQVVSALEAVHAAGIVHRDLKPSNVFLLEGGGASGDRVKLLDFGIAKAAAGVEGQTEGLTATDEVFGTVGYMAPEMAMGTTNDPRSDIYSVGVLMYRMLSGHLPFTGSTSFEVMTKQANQPPPSLRQRAPSVPAGVEEIVLHALEPKPSRRIATMAALGEALSRGCSDRHASLAFSETAPIQKPPAAPPASTLADDAPTRPEPGGTEPMGTEPAHHSAPEPDEPSVETSPPDTTPHGIGPSTAPSTRDSAEDAGTQPAMAPPAHREPRSRVLVGVLAVVALAGVGSTAALLMRDEPPSGPALAASTPASPEPAATPPLAETPASTSVTLTPPHETPTTVGPEPDGVGDPAESENDTGPAAASTAVGPEDSPEPTTTEDAPPPDPPTRRRRTRKSPKAAPQPGNEPAPPTDAQVVTRLKQKLFRKCKADGNALLTVEGLVSSGGLILSPLITPPHPEDDCIRTLVKQAQFARGQKLRSIKFTILL